MVTVWTLNIPQLPTKSFGCPVLIVVNFEEVVETRFRTLSNVYDGVFCELACYLCFIYNVYDELFCELACYLCFIYNVYDEVLCELACYLCFIYNVYDEVLRE